MQESLFATASGFGSALDVRDDVLEVLMAVAILHYHDMLELAPEGPYIARVKQAIGQLRITEEEISSWALTIQSDLIKRKNRPPASQPPPKPTIDDVVGRQTRLIQQQMLLIDNLSDQVKELSERVMSLEKGGVPRAPATQIAAVAGNDKPMSGAIPGRSRPKSSGTNGTVIRSG
jgi:hypothetical protein